ncbi:mercuric ion binding protein [Rhizobiales bacterium GAS191]|jgi:mercuric ion binding protein|nr:mercuric ion binding protein [Rhizobiales bacterium GAS113]SED99651.1 mercuric ion binding protein [Rhizobiales bacterium GAS188]SEE53709.1 mercuric ion binding protein [Rhizobiales bacterium GAS191]
MKLLPLVALTAVLFSSAATFAAERAVTLTVANATCELCGPIVKRSLTRLSGVLDVQISEAEGAAIAKIRFDDSRTEVPALIAATTNAGYPSRVVQ